MIRRRRRKRSYMQIQNSSVVCFSLASPIPILIISEFAAFFSLARLNLVFFAVRTGGATEKDMWHFVTTLTGRTIGKVWHRVLQEQVGDGWDLIVHSPRGLRSKAGCQAGDDEILVRDSVGLQVSVRKQLILITCVESLNLHIPL
jgi:hypothetical protein